MKESLNRVTDVSQVGSFCFSMEVPHPGTAMVKSESQTSQGPLGPSELRALVTPVLTWLTVQWGSTGVEKRLVTTPEDLHHSNRSW